jgi:hypothetical protein
MSKLELPQDIKEFLDQINFTLKELEKRIIEDPSNLLSGKK